MTTADFLRWIFTGKKLTDVEKNLRSAERGNPKAQLTIGLCYIQGTDVPKNSTEAARWFRLAAKQGNAEAEFYLGRAFSTGDGVLKNPEFAYAWFVRASEHDHKKAQEWRSIMEQKMTAEEIAEGLALSKEAVGLI